MRKIDFLVFLKHSVHNSNTANRLVGCQNKRGRPAAFQSAKSNEQKKTLVKPKLALIESGSSNSNESYKDDHLVSMASDVNGQKTCASVQGSWGSAMERANDLSSMCYNCRIYRVTSLTNISRSMILLFC